MLQAVQEAPLLRSVLLVEDHPLVAEATSKLLAQQRHELATVICADAAQAIHRLDDPETEWFRIFLDLDVPGAYGLSLAHAVHRRGLAGRCCIISAFDNQLYIDELRARGFLGYIVKATSVAQFDEALAKVLRGERSFPDTAHARRLQPIRLTRRQTEILELLRRGCSSKEVGIAIHLAEGTVNNHIAAVLQALDADTRTQAVARAIELGFLGVGDRESCHPARRRE